MAVAFMANAQHLVYRKDILNKLNISVPKTYEEMLAAAKKIRESGLAKNPVGGAYKAGWNLAQELIICLLVMVENILKAIQLSQMLTLVLVLRH